MDSKPAIGTKVVTTRNFLVIVSGHPIKEKHQDKVWVFKGKEFGCNATFMTKFINLRLPTEAEAASPNYIKLQSELAEAQNEQVQISQQGI